MHEIASGRIEGSQPGVEPGLLTIRASVLPLHSWDQGDTRCHPGATPLHLLPPSPNQEGRLWVHQDEYIQSLVVGYLETELPTAV